MGLDKGQGRRLRVERPEIGDGRWGEMAWIRHEGEEHHLEWPRDYGELESTQCHQRWRRESRVPG